MTYKLYIPVDETGYSFAENASVLQNQTKGGFSRFRNDLEYSSIGVSLSWTMTLAEYNELINFWKVGANRGGSAFLIDLIIDDATLVTHTAFFSTNGPQITQIVGDNILTVSDTLEVLPTPADDDFDNSIVSVYSASEGDPVGYLNLFNKLVNIDLVTIGT